MSKNKIRIKCSEVFNKIYAGHVLKSGMWASNREDVTVESIAAATQAHYISSAIKYAMRQGRKEGTDDAAKARVYMKWSSNNVATVNQREEPMNQSNQNDDVFFDDFGNAYLPDNEYSWHEVENKNAELIPL